MSQSQKNNTFIQYHMLRVSFKFNQGCLWGHFPRPCDYGHPLVHNSINFYGLAYPTHIVYVCVCVCMRELKIYIFYLYKLAANSQKSNVEIRFKVRFVKFQLLKHLL